MKLEYFAKASNVIRSVKANDLIHPKLSNIVLACLASADEEEVVSCTIFTDIGECANPCIDPYRVEVLVSDASGTSLAKFKASDVMLKPNPTGSTIL